ncbi:MAG: hypothetical protein Q9195_005123 [Heterodermia aff. obscurata]
MTLQILTLYLKDDVQLTGSQQEPACRQMLTALSRHLKSTAFYQITFLSNPPKVELLIGLQPTATSLEISTSSALHEPLFSHTECPPSIKYLTASKSLEQSIGSSGYPCDVLTLRFPPSTPAVQQETCLKALDYLLLASRSPGEIKSPESPYVGKIAGFIKEEFGVAGGDPAVFRAYIMWESDEKKEVFKARHGGRHLWDGLDDVGTREWTEDIGFYDALEKIWATEGVDVESGWIKTIAKVEYMSRSARALSNAKAWISSSGH